MSSLVDLIGGTATGGALGLVGSVISKGATYLVDKQKAKDDREAKLVDYAHEKDMALIQQDNTQQASEQQFALNKMQSEFEVMKTSIQDQTQLSGRTSQIVTDILALVRPGLTLLLILATMLVAFAINNGATEILMNPFYQFSSMAAMAVAWWFGDKVQTPNGGKK